MKRTIVAAGLVLLSLACAAMAQDQQQAGKMKVELVGGSPPLDKYVNKLWEAFKHKDKATLSALIDDKFRQFEEGLSTFGDKKTEVNAVDEYDLISYTLSDFTVKPLSANMVLVTYIAQYEGRTGAEVAKAKSVFGEVWSRTGKDWKCLYMQETYVK